MCAIYIYIYVCVCVYIYIYIYIYMCALTEPVAAVRCPCSVSSRPGLLKPNRAYSPLGHHQR